MLYFNAFFYQIKTAFLSITEYFQKHLQTFTNSTFLNGSVHVLHLKIILVPSNNFKFG